MISRFTTFAIALIASAAASVAGAQTYDTYSTHRSQEADTVVFLPWFDEELADDLCLLDSTNIVADTVIIDRWRPIHQIPVAEYRPAIFDTWLYLDTIKMLPERRPEYAAEAFEWLDDVRFGTLLVDNARQNYMNANPSLVKYNTAWLPEELDQFTETVDHLPTRIKLQEEQVGDRRSEIAGELLDVERRNWIQNLNASVQFSQSYVSPNWYQGGSNSLIMLINAVYNVKLNQKFHPKLLFESTISYKLGTNSAPDDSIRSYNISEDLFQINSTFGYKAMRNWYYSATLQFKTQLFNSYKSNSSDLKSAFLSPGELNLGLGMTYNHENAKKTFSCKATIAPLSWQLLTCINNNIDETGYDIKPGRNMVSNYGSSAEYNMTWKIAYNITYTSRMFLFSDYSAFQGDWEHTVAFRINRYLTTQIYAHMRYDTSTPRCDDPSWHKFQFKEVLSFGFAYTFSNI